MSSCEKQFFWKGEYIWRTEDILKVIEEEGDSIALIHLSGKEHLVCYIVVNGWLVMMLVPSVK